MVHGKQQQHIPVSQSFSVSCSIERLVLAILPGGNTPEHSRGMTLYSLSLYIPVSQSVSVSCSIERLVLAILPGGNTPGQSRGIALFSLPLSFYIFNISVSVSCSIELSIISGGNTPEVGTF